MHACPESTLTLECTVDGVLGDATVGKGTAFSCCDNSEIVLLHNQFGRVAGDIGQCNGGAIIGRSMRVENNNSTYISQLKVAITPKWLERTS